MKSQNNDKRLTGIGSSKVKHQINHGLFLKEILQNSVLECIPKKMDKRRKKGKLLSKVTLKKMKE